MYNSNEIMKSICFDMETNPMCKWEDLDEVKKEIWLHKYHMKFYKKEIEFLTEQAQKQYIEEYGKLNLDANTIYNPTTEEIWNKYSPLIAEFGKIWCISFGVFDDKKNISINTLQSDNEVEMIEEFIQILDAYPDFVLSGYNILGFDIPFLLKRMWINGILTYPVQLKLKAAKPWSINHIDLMLDWKNISNENVSLEIVCQALNIQSPKDKFQNYEFSTLIMNKEISVDDGVEYCEKDVKAVMQAFLKLISDISSFEIEKKTWAKK